MRMQGLPLEYTCKRLVVEFPQRALELPERVRPDVPPGMVHAILHARSERNSSSDPTSMSCEGPLTWSARRHRSGIPPNKYSTLWSSPSVSTIVCSIGTVRYGSL